MRPPADEAELLNRALASAGRTLGEIADRHGVSVPTDLKRAKGWVGELLETALGATAQSRPVPDFEAIGVELKTIPLNARHQPQESTFVSTAPLARTIGLRWEDSTVKAKLDRVLWVPVEAVHDVPVRRRRIGTPLLWSPSQEDAEILRADWEEHIERIALGYLDELDARLGTYLQVRPKALNRRDRTGTVSNTGAATSTLPRGFYLRTCFTRKIIGDL
jgi:DNA mismatch repair protein MutH